MKLDFFSPFLYLVYMSKIKLDPAIDLGLANDPNFNSQDAREIEVEVQTDLSSITKSSQFQGIGNISAFQNSSPEVMSSSNPNSSSPTSGVSLIVSLLLFLVASGVLVFFLLQYFKVI